MNRRFQMMDELMGQTYPIRNWEPNSVAEGRLLRRAEQKDMPTALKLKNGGLSGEHVELRIETLTGTWQPQENHQEVDSAAIQQTQQAIAMKPESAQNAKGKTELQVGASVFEKAQDLAPASDSDIALETQNNVAETQALFPGAVELSATEEALLEQWAPERYRMPTFFGLLVQIGKLASDPQNRSPVTTERLLARSTLEAADIRAETFRFLKTAWNLGLLHRHGELGKNNGVGSIWSLTADGRRYLVNGVRARIILRKGSTLSCEQICKQLSDDEIQDWEMDLRERNRLIEKTLTPLAKEKPADGSGKTIKKRLASKLTDEPGATKAVSRAELVRAIEDKALSQAKKSEPGLGSLWAGLVR